jgi:hypothetical protein
MATKTITAPAVTKGTKVANPTKATKSLDKVNAQKAAKDVTAEKAPRELKYAYPEDFKTNSQKKAFRRNARAAAKRFEKALAELGKSTDPHATKDLKAKRQEFIKFQQETYTHPSA